MASETTKGGGTSTPISKELVDGLIAQLGIQDFAKATIREVKQVAAMAEKQSGVEFIKMEMGIPGLPACDNAFSQCEKLNCVILAEGIIEIEPTAFRLCSKLRELHIPATVETLDLSIISYWNGLENLFFEGTHTKITKGFDCSTRGLTLYVKPGSSAEEYAIQNEESYLFF